MAGFIVASCHQKRDKGENYFYEGFLKDNVFQCIITVKPDKDTQGLVKRRENALRKAKLQIKKKAAEALADYCLKSKYESEVRPEEKQFQIYKETLINKLNKIGSKGALVMQYYNEDDSVIAVYRIKINNLKYKINAIASDILK